MCSIQNLVLTTEGSFEDKVVDGKIELTYDQHTFTYTGHIADESTRGQTLYTARTQLTHPASNLDFKWEGQMKEDSETKSATMETNYLTSYDRQMKTATFRAEINKIRNTLDMQVIYLFRSIINHFIFYHF